MLMAFEDAAADGEGNFSQPSSDFIFLDTLPYIIFHVESFNNLQWALNYGMFEKKLSCFKFLD
jgi:hypothetical protein